MLRLCCQLLFPMRGCYVYCRNATRSLISILDIALIWLFTKKNKFLPLEFYNLLMHDDLVMFKGKYTLNKVRFPFWAIYFLLKELRRETIWTVRFRFFAVKLLLNWTFFVFSIHNVRPSNLFCCLSLFKASRVWKILMTLSKQQVSFGIFSSISFRKPAKHLLLGLIYHKLHFLTTNFGSELLWWGFLGIQTKSTILST